MPYLVTICFRPKGKPEYEYLGVIDIDEAPTSQPEQTIRLPDRGNVRVHIDRNHLVRVHEAGADTPPALYVSEI